MKAVILAAGKGTRMFPLTKVIPKTLVEVGGRPLIEHIIDSFPSVVDEFIVVVGYKGNLIKNHLSLVFPNKHITYVRQKELSGTADALLLCRKYFLLPKERFFIVYGDEWPTRAEVKKCLKYQFAWLCHALTTSIATGVVTVSKKGIIVGAREKREGTKPPFISSGGLMLVDSEIFSFSPEQHKNGEFYLTSMLSQFIKKYPVHAVMGRPDLYFTTQTDIDKFNNNS